MHALGHSPVTYFHCGEYVAAETRSKEIVVLAGEKGTSYVYPKWGSKKFLDIRRKTVTELLDWIKDNHSAAMADYVLATIRSIMTWQQKREDDYVSPIVKGMRQGNGEARRRILNENEIRRLWQPAGESGTLGHALPGVRGVYNRYDYADEKADALQRLAAKIETIVNPPSGNNVVTFAR